MSWLRYSWWRISSVELGSTFGRDLLPISKSEQGYSHRLALVPLTLLNIALEDHSEGTTNNGFFCLTSAFFLRARRVFLRLGISFSSLEAR
jgi:hypothetical protein